MTRYFTLFLLVAFVCAEDNLFIPQDDSVSFPTPLTLFATKIATGGYSTSVLSRGVLSNNSLTFEGKVYYWGFGAFGDDPLEFPEDETVDDIECGGYHCLALSSSGRIYEWGRLGNESSVKPRLLDALKHIRVVKIAAGYEHNIAITESGMVYSWGSSLNGKLGRVDASENDLDAVLNPYRSPALLEWKEANPPHIVTGDAGGDFTVLVDGNLWSFGINTNGQLGLGKRKEAEGQSHTLTVPTQIQFSSTPFFVSVSCGGDHSLALTREGKVYSWGWGEKGALGLGNFKDQWRPKMIPLDQEIVAVGAGGYGHSLILSKNGSLYSFGWNEFRQLGGSRDPNDPQDRKDSPLPRLVPRLPPIFALASGGFKHSAVLARDGSVFVFGDNGFSQLGPLTISHMPPTDAQESHQDDIQSSAFTKYTMLPANVKVLDNLVHEETEDQTCNNLEQPPFEFGIASDKNGNLILEDTALIDPYLKLPNSKAIYLSLFDGSGGKNVAEYLQHNLYKQILTEFEKTGSTNIENTFTTAYAELDKAIDNPSEGSTALSCIFRENSLEKQVTCGNVGDTLAFIIKDSGEWEILSEEHHLNSKLSPNHEEQRIRDAGVAVRQNKLNGQLQVSRSFGHKIHPAIISSPFTKSISWQAEVEDKKWLVLASNHLWSALSFERISKISSNSYHAQQLAINLMEEVVKQGLGGTDITILTLRLY